MAGGDPVVANNAAAGAPVRHRCYLVTCIKWERMFLVSEEVNLFVLCFEVISKLNRNN